MQPGINLPAFKSNVCKFLPDNTESQVLFYTNTDTVCSYETSVNFSQTVRCHKYCSTLTVRSGQYVTPNCTTLHKVSSATNTVTPVYPGHLWFHSKPSNLCR